MQLIETDIFLTDDTTESNPVNVYIDGEIFETIDRENNVRHWKLTQPFYTIVDEHGDEILEYRGLSPLYDSVSMGDIFIHGKFVEEIK